METIVAVERNHAGEIISFKTSDDRIISYRKAVMEAAEGSISGVKLSETGLEEGSSITIEDTFEEFPMI
ncbi:DUF3892 domain-containing protein [Niallia taxi]|uniref:DUF3892 domain-containing protein n=1 Tax=Niallia taxi TaxID=2499688 RepID=UPI00119D7CB7|nr:DUF3892 domain-containing protein [Niallia taxi]MCT2345389.1 hypothetical protein [Niallia taxi]MDE5051936.1 hypothetical protein [Niallia taxi]WOD61097.1 hypothetical protein NQZ71_09605 [Niallia taxi]